MKTNLFDYATKELSQDAFICWFIANYDSEIIGKHSYGFIRFLTKRNIKDGEITHIDIKQQEHDMDVVIDFWTTNPTNKNSNFVLVIEDKTYSSLHDNQLVDYGKRVAKWDDADKRTIKVFFKTDYLTEKDKEELKKAKKEGYEWEEYDLDTVYNGLFKNIPNTESEILNSYVEHVKKLYNDYHIISNEKTDCWTKANWSKFFVDTMAKEFPGVECRVDSFRRIYNSLIVNYSLENKNKYLKYATFEMRIGKKIRARIHPSFNYAPSNEWYWSYNQIEELDKNKEAYNELLDLRTFVENSGSKIIVRGNTARAFGKIKGYINNDDVGIDAVWPQLREWISEFLRIVSEYAKQ